MVQNYHNDSNFTNQISTLIILKLRCSYQTAKKVTFSYKIFELNGISAYIRQLENSKRSFVLTTHHTFHQYNVLSAIYCGWETWIALTNKMQRFVNRWVCWTTTLNDIWIRGIMKGRSSHSPPTQLPVSLFRYEPWFLQ